MAKPLKTAIIQQVVMLPGPPRQIFELWMDSAKHAALTGGEAHIVPRVGGKFTVFDGWATGTTIELVPNKKIVQTWRADDWPVGVESTITLTLLPVTGGTKLLFRHDGVPKQSAKSVAQGWQDYYWKPMKVLLANHVS